MLEIFYLSALIKAVMMPPGELGRSHLPRWQPDLYWQILIRTVQNSAVQWGGVHCTGLDCTDLTTTTQSDTAQFSLWWRVRQTMLCNSKNSIMHDLVLTWLLFRGKTGNILNSEECHASRGDFVLWFRRTNNDAQGVHCFTASRNFNRKLVEFLPFSHQSFRLLTRLELLVALPTIGTSSHTRHTISAELGRIFVIFIVFFTWGMFD